MSTTMHTIDDNTPILVGVGQYCPAQALLGEPGAPVDLAAVAARRALCDSGQPESLGKAVDTLIFFKLFVDMGFAPSPLGKSTQPPCSLAQRLGLQPQHLVYSSVGGNLPQKMINDYAEQIAQGRTQAVLLAGGEALRTSAVAQRQGVALDWNENPDGNMLDLGQGDDLVSSYEYSHGIGMPTSSYALFEHAIRGRRGRSLPEHLLAMGDLCARLNQVARQNPLAAAPSAMTARELVTPSPANRMICHPYTRVVNANDRVDQAAAVILTSAGLARRLGIDSSRWIFLRGCADTKAKLRTLDHVDFHSSPALALAARKAMEQAGVRLAQIDFFDLYSCFPSAVEMACDALGLDEDDPRPLTVTGGLPFFGGPGNAYVLHAVAETVEWLRRARGRYALVSGNGGFMSKQSVGIYSTEPGTGPWSRTDPAQYQSELDALVSPTLDLTPQGRARIESYTVIHERGEPKRGVVVGRLLASDARFVANTPPERPDLLRWLMEAEPLGALGEVSSHGEARPSAAVTMDNVASIQGGPRSMFVPLL